MQQSELEAALFGGSFSFGDDRTISNQASLLRTSAVVRAVARQPEFRGEVPGALLSKLTAVPRGGQDFIDISVIDADPCAPRLANAFAAAFIANRSSVLRAKVVRAREAAQKELDKPRRVLGTGWPATTSHSACVSFKRWNRTERQRRAGRPSDSGVQVAPKPRRNAIFAALMSLLWRSAQRSASTALTDGYERSRRWRGLQTSLARDASAGQRRGAA